MLSHPWWDVSWTRYIETQQYQFKYSTCYKEVNCHEKIVSDELYQGIRENRSITECHNKNSQLAPKLCYEFGNYDYDSVYLNICELKPTTCVYLLHNIGYTVGDKVVVTKYVRDFCTYEDQKCIIISTNKVKWMTEPVYVNSFNPMRFLTSLDSYDHQTGTEKILIVLLALTFMALVHCSA
jgi:hypothetical protein